MYIEQCGQVLTPKELELNLQRIACAVKLLFAKLGYLFSPVRQEKPDSE